MPSGLDVVGIAASFSGVDRLSPPAILRMRRDTEGRARTALPSDMGLLAQGSDVPEATDALVRDIGLTARKFRPGCPPMHRISHATV